MIIYINLKSHPFDWLVLIINYIYKPGFYSGFSILKVSLAAGGLHWLVKVWIHSFLASQEIWVNLPQTHTVTHKNTHVSRRHQHWVTVAPHESVWPRTPTQQIRGSPGSLSQSVCGCLCVSVYESVGGFRACSNSWAIWSWGGLVIKRSFFHSVALGL